MSEQDTTVRLVPDHVQARKATAGIGPIWFAGQAARMYEIQRAFTLNEDDDNGQGAALLWLYHGTEVAAERQAEADKVLEGQPPEARAVQTVMDMFSVGVDTPEIRDEGLCYGLDHFRSHVAKSRLVHGGCLSPDLVDDGDHPMGVGVSLVEIDADGHEHQSMYLVNGVGHSFIWRVAMTGPHTGQMTTVTADLDLDSGSVLALERQATAGDLHPYLVSLWLVWITVSMDTDRLGVIAGEEISDAVRAMFNGHIAGFSVGGVTVASPEFLAQLMRKAPDGDKP